MELQRNVMPPPEVPEPTTEAGPELPPLTRIPADAVCLADYERHAQRRMTASTWAYLNGGAADELTLRDNRAAFDRLRLTPRVLTDMHGGHTHCTLLGRSYPHHILLAPVALQKLAHVDGELATAQAAAALGAGLVVSTQASATLEDIARATAAASAGDTSSLWFQLYMQPDRGDTLALVRRAEVAGYAALVLTVDAPVQGLRNREQRTGFALPPGIEAVNLRGLKALDHRPRNLTESPLFGSDLLKVAPTWDDLAWLQNQTALPVILKGILSSQDARQALDSGVAGIIVSNHGGRTLDGLPATIEALPLVAQAVAGRIPVLLDGGIRRGTDVFKALALGAEAVLIGRPYVHALATAGGLGVAHVLHLLRAEFEVAMVLTGCRTLAEVRHAHLWP